MKENWTYKKLGEVCSKITDGSHNPPKGVPNSNFIMISSQNVYNDHIEIKDVRYLSEDDFNREDKRTKVRANDVLLTIVGTVGRCAVVSEEIGSITLQRSVAVLTPKPFVNSRYLMYCCIGHNSTLNTNAHGIAQKGIYLKQLSELKIPIPSIETQSKIVNELDLLQSIIDKQKTQLKELDNLAQAAFYDMFGDPVENEKGWEVKPLQEICLRITDGSHFSPKEDENGIYPMLTVKDMDANGFNYDRCKYISEKDYTLLVANGCKPLANDVLVAKDGSYLKTAFVQKEEKEQVILSSIAILTPNNKIVSPEYLAFFFKLPETKNIVERNYLTGTAIKRVILKGFKVIKISIPPLHLQQTFAAKIESIEKQKAAIGKSIEETQKLFDYTMDKYFG